MSHAAASLSASTPAPETPRSRRRREAAEGFVRDFRPLDVWTRACRSFPLRLRLDDYNGVRHLIQSWRPPSMHLLRLSCLNRTYRSSRMCRRGRRSDRRRLVDNGEPWGDDWLWWAAGTVYKAAKPSSGRPPISMTVLMGARNMAQSESHDSEPSVQDVALIVGGGPGISASCARLFAQRGMRVRE